MKRLRRGGCVSALTMVVFLSAGTASGQIVTVSQLTCNPSSLSSGVLATCVVTLNVAAPSGGTEVSLSSNNTLLPLPANSVTVPAGATSTTFTATAASISSNQSATLTATALYSVELQWAASTSPNLTNYIVSRSGTSGGPYSVLATLGLFNIYTDYNVQAGQSYYYVVQAVNSAGQESAYSDQTWAAVPNLISQSATISLVASPLTTGNPSTSGVGGNTYFVQGSSNAASGTSTSLSVPFSSNTSPGDLILVGFDFVDSVTPVSITDSQGNTFTQVGSQLNSPAGVGARVYYANNIKGGADTVTITLSANSSYLEVYLTEYAGLNQTNPIDGQAGATGTAGAVSSGTITTTVAGDLIYGFCVGDWACTAGSGFNARSTFNGNLVEDETAGNPGSYAATGTATQGWTMQMVALKPQ
jgi:fibronectin type 3 domain-containing protein